MPDFTGYLMGLTFILSMLYSLTRSGEDRFFHFLARRGAQDRVIATLSRTTTVLIYTIRPLSPSSDPSCNFPTKGLPDFVHLLLLNEPNISKTARKAVFALPMNQLCLSIVEKRSARLFSYAILNDMNSRDHAYIYASKVWCGVFKKSRNTIQHHFIAEIDDTREFFVRGHALQYLHSAVLCHAADALMLGGFPDVALTR
jgi:hypothetical protein